ncbi:MAG: DUF167 domain-containing protein [Verrucomicrobiota bacterium]|nr:DUF167 domain-containing protein [Verrucomicrobiota bacterium]
MITPPATTLDIRVVPNASRNQVVGWHAGALKVKVQAPPEGGRANEAVVEVLAETLGVPERAIVILRGATARNKQVSVTGLTLAQIQDKIP